jgi:hypothetical protein
VLNSRKDASMERKKPRYTKTRNIFLVLFLVSTFLALGLGISLNSYQVLPPIAITATPGGPPATATPGGPVPISVSNAEILTWLGTGASCLTSVVTFLGFVTTTIITWRKESREKADRELERKHKEIELEKEMLELERMKAEQEKRL